MQSKIESLARNDDRSNELEKILSLIMVNQENFEKDIKGMKRELGQRMKALEQKSYMR